MDYEISPGCRAMIEYLLRMRIIGGKHIPEDFVIRKLVDLHRKERKIALKDWEKCKKQGLILTKQKPTRLHVSLNPRTIKELCNLIGVQV